MFYIQYREINILTSHISAESEPQINRFAYLPISATDDEFSSRLNSEETANSCWQAAGDWLHCHYP